MIFNPFKKVYELNKKIILLYKTIDNRDKDIARLIEKNEELIALKVLTAEGFIKKMLPNLEWYDWQKLDHAGKQNYWNDARSILKNPVFLNELNAFKVSIVNHIATMTTSHPETMANRTLLVALEALENRFKDIDKPKNEEDEDDLDAVI
jgi:hypothetical protein